MREELVDILKKARLPFKFAYQYMEPDRSLEQNAYMWLIFGMVADYTGHDRYEVHDAFLDLFNLTWDLDPHTGEWRLRIIGTSEHGTITQEEFMLKVRAHCQLKMNLYLPLPNEIITNELIFNKSR